MILMIYLIILEYVSCPHIPSHIHSYCYSQQSNWILVISARDLILINYLTFCNAYYRLELFSFKILRLTFRIIENKQFR